MPSGRFVGSSMASRPALTVALMVIGESVPLECDTPSHVDPSHQSFSTLIASL